MNIPLLVASPDRATARAELLAAALANAAEGRFHFGVEPFFRDGPENGRQPVEIQNELVPVLIFAPSRKTYQLARAAALRLRTEQCIWSAIHIFTDDDEAAQDSSNDWHIQIHPVPPDDLREVVRDIDRRSGVARTDRQWFVAQALRTFANLLDDAIAPDTRGDDLRWSALRAELVRRIGELEQHVAIAAIDDLCREAQKIAEIQALDDKRMEYLLDRFNHVELQRESISADVYSMVHALKNKILLARWRPDQGTVSRDILASRCHQLLFAGCPSLPGDVAAPLETLLRRIETEIEHWGAETSARLEAAAPALRIAARRLLALTEHTSSAEASRIVIVEDDPEWSTRLAALIASIPLPRPLAIQRAANVYEARALLKSEGAAVVMLDLGLPMESDGHYVPDAGLELVAEFSRPHPTGRLPQHTFLILTAGESFGAAVGKALDLGIGPAAYLRKNSATLGEELETRIHAALRPRRPVRIDVFAAAPRLIHMEATEVTLDLPLWSLLMILAAARRKWVASTTVAERLALPPYSLDPESRSDDLADPAERIERQLQKYRSELNLQLIDACRRIRGQFPQETIIEFDDELGYRLNANARLLTTVPYIPPERRPRVLVVEDAPEWSERITRALEHHGFEPFTARTLESARKQFTEIQPDLVTLDLELPENEDHLRAGIVEHNGGLLFLKWIAESGTDVPVVVLTATSKRDHTVLPLLNAGVRYDDYLFKQDHEPIHRLLASLERLWREVLLDCRVLNWSPTKNTHSIAIDVETRCLKAVGGFPVKGSGLGELMLQTLASRPNAFVGRAELIDRLFPNPDEGPEDPERALDQHIKRLRKAISDQTNGTIDGADVICGGRGIYWLRGIVQPASPDENEPDLAPPN